MTNFTYLLMPVAAGVLLSSQIAIEIKTKTIFGHFLPASVLAFGVAFIVCLVWSFYIGINPFPSNQQMTEMKWYYYLGGIIRVLYLMLVVNASLKYGNGLTCSVVVVAQLVASIIIEHFGFFDMPIIKINPQRVVGAMFLVLGVYFVGK